MAYLKLLLLKTLYLIYNIIFQVGAYFPRPPAPPREGLVDFWSKADGIFEIATVENLMFDIWHYISSGGLFTPPQAPPRRG